LCRRHSIAKTQKTNLETNTNKQKENNQGRNINLQWSQQLQCLPLPEDSNYLTDTAVASFKLPDFKKEATTYKHLQCSWTFENRTRQSFNTPLLNPATKPEYKHRHRLPRYKTTKETTKRGAAGKNKHLPHSTSSYDAITV